MDRREFIQRSTLATIYTALGNCRPESAGAESMISITKPFHGAILNHRHGQQENGRLKIEVVGEAPLRDIVIVNKNPARREGTRFIASVFLSEKETDITAVAEGNQGRNEHRIRVVWDRNSQPRYRFSIDDNSFFLRDVFQKQYASLFDCFYLQSLRDLHTKYGTRFVLNCFYTTGDGFELNQFPDRYKKEWEDNADWLKLAFHAYSEFPDRPYQHASPDKLLQDMDTVAEQIVRFAGETVYSPPTVIHWAMAQPASWKALAERGVRVLSGYFSRVDTGWDINYLVDDERSEYVSRHDALKDFESGIVFSRVDIVCNNTPVEKIVPTLEPLTHNPDTAEIMDIFTHEQYFWPFYFNYVPDHVQRLETAIRWLTEQGYKPVFYHEGFLGGSDE